MKSRENLGLLKLLRLCGFDTSAPSKLVRHRDARFDVDEILRRGWLDSYQGYQAKPIFDGLRYVVSFVGVGTTQARLVGVYEVLGRKPGVLGCFPKGCPHEEWKDCKYFYDMRRLPGFEALEGRVVIEWGRAAVSWHQRLREKPVLEILRGAEAVPVFNDYLDFAVTHDELRQIVKEPEIHREWRSRLRAVAGVYLILATDSGQQYVGSAYGTDGIWGRWQHYAVNGHGGNELLKRLVAKNAQYPGAFRYSVLQVLPKSATRNDVIQWETRFKQKLGSRATGLNLN